MDAASFVSLLGQVTGWLDDFKQSDLFGNLQLQSSDDAQWRDRFRGCLPQESALDDGGDASTAPASSSRT